MGDLIDITLLTTDEPMNVTITKEMLSDLAEMLRTEDDPVPVHFFDRSADVVGVLIRSKSSADFPKIIITDKSESAILDGNSHTETDNEELF